MTILTTTPAIGSLPLNTVGVKIKQLTDAEQAAASDTPIFLAPERGDPLTRHIECVACVDHDALSPSQRSDVQLGQKVVEAYWKAVQAYQLWCTPEQWPMFRCVRTALQSGGVAFLPLPFRVLSISSGRRFPRCLGV